VRASLLLGRILLADEASRSPPRRVGISIPTCATAATALIARAEVPVIRFHDLRLTSATLMLAGGVHGKIVQERLGHSSIAMTL
jgi:integrase